MSNKDLTTHNDIAKLYQKAPIEIDGSFICPVCKKSYKRLSSLEKHMEKIDCFKIGDIFKNTMYEEMAHEVFNGIHEKNLPLFVFRKSPIYSMVMKFVIFCITNEIKDMGVYYSYVKSICKRTNLNYILKVAVDKKDICAMYRDFLHKNPEYISQDFLKDNIDNLVKDPLYLTRSLEKAHIRVADVMELEEFEDVIENLPTDYYLRVEKIYELYYKD